MLKLSKLVVGGILLAMSASALPAQATVITTTNPEVSGIKIADRGHHGDNDRDDYYEGNRGRHRGWYKKKKKHHNQGYYSNGANNRYGTPVIYVPQPVIYIPQQTCINTRFGRRCQ
jgi:hypothetical protein